MKTLKFRKGEKVVVELYGQKIDLTKEVESGKTVFELFGDKYEIVFVEVKDGKK